MKPILSDVTICSADSLMPHLALMAIEKSLKQCGFARAILFTDKDIKHKKEIELIRIKKLNSVEDYSRFILKELHKYITTKFILIVQWDGYVLDGKKWDNSFYNYDLIGAKWSWHRDSYKVGNGGFTLRSLKLQKIIATNEFPFKSDLVEDLQICKFYRKKLTAKYRIKFASEDIADKFSYEKRFGHTNTFGFHGFFNFYRHTYNKDLSGIVKHLDKKIFHTKEFRELAIQYILHKKLNSFLILHHQLVRYANFKYLLKFYFHVLKRIFLNLFYKK
jgi:hypothetical protein